MTDYALSLIIRTLNELELNTLLAIDEHTDVNELTALNNKTLITAITQRVDQYQKLQSLGFDALLSDYDLTEIKPQSFDCLAIRISKQKAISHHLLNQNHLALTEHGKVIIAGGKTEGIKSLAKNLGTVATLLSKQRAKAQHELYQFQRFKPNEPLCDHNYPSLRLGPTYSELQFLTKPGVYGWQKIDRGSELLMNCVSKLGIPRNSDVLDLGCGYGFLAVLAGTDLNANITATDNNIAAVHACAENLKRFNCEGTAVVSNCADTISQRFDLVLCNPPFHTGFDIDNNLTLRFVKSAKQHLKASGTAYFVVNSFIGLEKNAAPHFNHIQLLTKADGFSVFSLKNSS